MVEVCRNKENNQQGQTMPVNDRQRQPVPSWFYLPLFGPVFFIVPALSLPCPSLVPGHVWHNWKIAQGPAQQV
jgi:hypothetical protein